MATETVHTTAATTAANTAASTAANLYAEQAADTNEIQVVVFRLGPELYGVDIGTVMEINTMQKITPVPRAPADVRGIMNLRGRIVTVVDLRSRLGLTEAEDTRDTRIMVVECDGAMVGCLVDAVQEVLTLPESIIEPAEAVTTLSVEYLHGIAKLERGLVALVDLRQVLSDYLQAAS